MNFTEVLLSIDLVLESGYVPLIVGESGIGKTALIKRLCEEKNYYNVVIDGNMLKEGEIGGLPTVEDYEVFINGKHLKKKRTVYAIHSKLQTIEEMVQEDPVRKIVLFIDEINRCEHAVQQELMNIVLNREINGYILPSNVLVIAAMNPSGKYDSYSENEYMVVEMDSAQENRFVWIEMEVDVNAWITWGMEKKSEDCEFIRIDEVVLDFISSYPQYLHTPKSLELAKATPRSWERISDIYRVLKRKRESLPEKVFFNVVKGNVGAAIAQEFLSFLSDDKNPIIKPYEIFNEGVSDELIRKIKMESHSRLYLIAKNALKYIEDLVENKYEVNIFSELLQFFPPDLKLGIMKEIRQEYKDTLYKEFMKNNNFIEGYFALHTDIEGYSND